MVTSDGLFGRVLSYPDAEAQERLDALVGVDKWKTRLVRETKTLLDPSLLEAWSLAHYKTIIPAVREVTDRTALVVLTGDVGTGKTELAESFPNAVARDLKIAINLYPLSLSARGRGAVGEMTTLLDGAFDKVIEASRSSRDSKGRLRSAVVLLIDEADALAQARDLAQMHHEDRAGVNALIRGIDALRRARAPVVTVMCTNRGEALDPAVVRRAAAILTFSRPDDEQRHQLLEMLLAGTGVAGKDLDELVRLTGPTNGRRYGFTFSDIRQRLIVEAVLTSLDAGPLTGAGVIEIASAFEPTPPFGGSGA